MRGRVYQTSNGKRFVPSHQPPTVKHAQRSLRNIPRPYLDTLLDSLPRTGQAVIDANEFAIEYWFCLLIIVR
ncbi:unnamed protein product [Haemonchus placei]|uniref:Transposase n=1 Tax=Haemonchus placei TaxID=6290 RepID=A0A0N4WL93_HAEPC|nr:unnamed protein product [Haemonchus placei]